MNEELSKLHINMNQYWSISCFLVEKRCVGMLPFQMLGMKRSRIGGCKGAIWGFDV